MKKTLLILTLLLISFTGISQTLIHTDTLTFRDDLILLKWYHEEFNDRDGITPDKFTLTNVIGLIKEFQFDGYTYVGAKKQYIKELSETDSIKNPYGENYYQAPAISNIIYNGGEAWKDTLSKYYVLNEPLRLLE